MNGPSFEYHGHVKLTSQDHGYYDHEILLVGIGQEGRTLADVLDELVPGDWAGREDARPLGVLRIAVTVAP